MPMYVWEIDDGGRLMRSGSLPGGCEGTGQSNDKNLLALGVLENIDLLGFKVREELELGGELSQRHAGGCFFDSVL